MESTSGGSAERPLQVYCAGKTHDYERVREVQALVRRHGGEITCDWTGSGELTDWNDGGTVRQEYARLSAANDIRGVVQADLIIVMPHLRLCGTLIEIGAAISHEIPVIFLGQPSQRSIFWAHVNVWRTTALWPACEHDLNDILQIVSTYPNYDERNPARELRRLARDSHLNEGDQPLLYPVDVDGLQPQGKVTMTSSQAGFTK